MTTAPTRTLEKNLLAAGHRLVAGMDEVGRGALAGPVSVGVVVVDASTGRMPAGLRDSKVLTPAGRMRLVTPIRTWARAGAVGHASNTEIDRHGLIAALCLAGHRALAEIGAAGFTPDVLLLDGIHDWLHAPTPIDLPCPTPPVMTQVKGDLRVASIAAASILAKTERDARMRDHHADHPDYGWDGNKGYAAATHMGALRRLGASPLHRVSWKLPTGPRATEPAAGPNIVSQPTNEV